MIKAESHVAHRLSAHSFAVKFVNCESHPTADLLASYNEENFLIEVKTRELPNDCGKALRTRNGYSMIFDARPTSARSKALRTARRQVRSTPVPAGTFRLLWYFIPEDFPREIGERELLFTLYGIKEMLCHVKNVAYESHCYYWHPSFFGKAPDIVATVMEGDNHLVFCLNEFSPDVSRFRRSSLYRLPKSRVVDPAQDEMDGLILKCSSERTGGIEALLEKYGFDSIELFTRRLHHGMKRSYV